MAWSWSISWNCILPDFQTKRINITLPERVLAVVNEQARREGVNLFYSRVSTML